MAPALSGSTMATVATVGWYEGQVRELRSLCSEDRITTDERDAEIRAILDECRDALGQDAVLELVARIVTIR